MIKGVEACAILFKLYKRAVYHTYRLCLFYFRLLLRVEMHQHTQSLLMVTGLRQMSGFYYPVSNPCQNILQYYNKNKKLLFFTCVSAEYTGVHQGERTLQASHTTRLQI